MSNRKGFTLIEATMVCGLTAFLAILLSAAWNAVARPSADLIARGQIIQEMDLAVATLARDLGGSLNDPSSRSDGRTLGRWVGWQYPSDPSYLGSMQLWLCFDGGNDPDAEADWGVLDTVIHYYLAPDPDATVSTKVLIRWNLNDDTTFTVARNIDAFTVASEGADDIRIVLSFTCRQLTRTCTLVAKKP